MLDTALIQSCWDEYAGTTAKSPVPQITVRPADAKAAKKVATKPAPAKSQKQP